MYKNVLEKYLKEYFQSIRIKKDDEKMPEVIREYRKDPHGVADTIVFGVRNLHESQTVFDRGNVAEDVRVNGHTITIYSPYDPLFVKEAAHVGEGYGATHDFGTVLGFDERCLQSLNHLELILIALAQRVKSLYRDQEVAPDLRQSYVYGGIDLERDIATGRLLFTHEIFPDIRREVSTARKYSSVHKRCQSCDIVRERKNYGYPVLFQRGIFRAYPPFSPIDTYAIEVFPIKHIPTLDRIELADQRDLAMILYEASGTMYRKAREHRETDSINFAVHSVPINFDKADDSCHMRVVMSLAEKLDKNGPFSIPFAGVRVVNEQPEEIIKRLKY